MDVLNAGNPQNLTKKYFFSLPEGVYLVSGAGVMPMVRHLSEYVAPADQRSAQWQKIREIHMDQKVCYVYKNEDEFCLDVKKHFGNVVRVIKTKEGVVLDPVQPWTKRKKK